MTHTKDEALLKALEDIKNNAGNPEKVYQISSAAIQQALATPVQEPVAWMPIETAPQDGTRPLLHTPKADGTMIPTQPPAEPSPVQQQKLERPCHENHDRHGP